LRGALDEIPTLRMIRLSAEEIGKRAQSFCERLRANLEPDITLVVRPGFSVIGGGSTPDQPLPTHLIAIASPHQSPAQMESRLRLPLSAASGVGAPDHSIPVIARIENDHVILDLRTVLPEEEATLLASIQSATFQD
jgi:L-seryl-tRNA(Ser) seleniumtransferase